MKNCSVYRDNLEWSSAPNVEDENEYKTIQHFEVERHNQNEMNGKK